MPKKEIKGESSAVKMPLEMKMTVVEFLRTSKARALGFDSISDVVTAGVRELLEKHGFYNTKEF